MARRVARHPFVQLGLVALVGAVACAQAEPVNEEVIDSGVGDVALGGAAGADAGTGGSSGAGGSSTTDAGDAAPSACQCDEPSCGVCPATQIVAAGGYGIFAQEVTNEAYQAWLDTQPNPQLQGGECAWNTSYVPAQGWPATDAKLPVNYVDFCDAAAYCRWAKRRLCGKIGGGANVYGDFASATKSQWHNACSAGGSKTYPYGATYAPTACNGADYGQAGPIAAGDAKGCEGGYPALRDMSGNVWEWEDSCNASAGAGDLCRIRGGSFSQGAAALGCGADSSLARNTTGKSVGFRCCE